MGATTAVQSGLSSYIYSRDQVIAFYLAQEAFEQIRNLRDQNSIAGDNWLSGIAEVSSDPCYFGKSCRLSITESNAPVECPSAGACPVLRTDPTNGFYGYNSSWTSTNFTRDISLTSISSDEVAVTVTITWPRGGSNVSFRARENLFNW